MSLAILTICLASAASAAEKPSQAFLKKAIEGNFAEIQIGQLARQKGQNDGVKKFGQMLSDDHAAANQKAIDAAKSMGMTPPDGPNAKQRADYEKMSKSGAQFDRDFAMHMVAEPDGRPLAPLDPQLILDLEAAIARTQKNCSP